MKIFLLVFAISFDGKANDPYVLGPYVTVAVCEQERERAARDNLLQRFAGEVGMACVRLKPLREYKS